MENTFTFNLEQGFDSLYKKGAFFTVGDMNKANTMTISWGSVGYMWNRPVFIAMIRTTRYSSEFIDFGKNFTISIPYDQSMKEALKICGTISGRDANKEKEANIKFIKSKKIETPVIEGCNRYFECKIVLKQQMDFDNLDKEIIKSTYKEGDAKHVLFFGEIVEQY